MSSWFGVSCDFTLHRGPGLESNEHIAASARIDVTHTRREEKAVRPTPTTPAPPSSTGCHAAVYAPPRHLMRVRLGRRYSRERELVNLIVRGGGQVGERACREPGVTLTWRGGAGPRAGRGVEWSGVEM